MAGQPPRRRRASSLNSDQRASSTRIHEMRDNVCPLYIHRLFNGQSKVHADRLRQREDELSGKAQVASILSNVLLVWLTQKARSAPASTSSRQARRVVVAPSHRKDVVLIHSGKSSEPTKTHLSFLSLSPPCPLFDILFKGFHFIFVSIVHPFMYCGYIISRTVCLFSSSFYHML